MLRATLSPFAIATRQVFASANRYSLIRSTVVNNNLKSWYSTEAVNTESEIIHSHHRIPQSVIPKVTRGIPKPTPEVPDVQTFLTKIGRNAIEHAELFEDSWEKLFTMSSQKMKDAGIETKLRRYILNWRDKFARGEKLKEIKIPKKSYGGARKKATVLAKLRAEKRAEERAQREANPEPEIIF